MSLLDDVLAEQGLTVHDVPRNTRLGKALYAEGVDDSEELQRIVALPRRGNLDVAQVVRLMTQHLKTPEGVQELLPQQAVGLLDLHDCRGMFGSLPVGTGKTLLALLAGTVLGLKPEEVVLLIPADHHAKTVAEAEEYAKNWRITMPQIVHYQLLSHKKHARKLYDMKPKLVVADEGHALRYLGTACTRRVGEYLRDNPEVIFVPMSGTLIGDALMGYSHLLGFALEEGSPLPRKMSETRHWAQALDKEPHSEIGSRRELGALQVFGETLEAAQKGLADFVLDTPGVVSAEASGPACSLTLSRWRPTLSPECRALIERARDPGAGQPHLRPDGVEILPEQVSGLVNQLSLEFYYVWKKPPPEPWMIARREWYRFVRSVLDEGISGLDSEGVIVDELAKLGEPCPQLEAWNAIRGTYEPERVPVWLGDSVLKQALARAQEHGKCVIWSKYRAVGAKLQELGIPHFGQGGVDASGMPIEKTTAPVVSASIQACGTGRNLQWWANALMLTVSSSAEVHEQNIGRHHRHGQTADAVGIEVIDAAYTHTAALQAARSHAEFLGVAKGVQQKLLLADWL